MASRSVRALVLGLPLLAGCAWSGPEVVPFRGPIPDQILLVPAIDRSRDPRLAAELDATVSAEVKRRGYQVLPPAVARNMLRTEGWERDHADLDDLPLADIWQHYQVDGVLVTEVLQWQADRRSGRYRFEVLWRILDARQGNVIWSWRKTGQVEPRGTQTTVRAMLPEDKITPDQDDLLVSRESPWSSAEVAARLQRSMALRLPRLD